MRRNDNVVGDCSQRDQFSGKSLCRRWWGLCRMFANIKFIIHICDQLRNEESLAVYRPERTARRIDASRRCLSAALVNPSVLEKHKAAWINVDFFRTRCILLFDRYFFFHMQLTRVIDTTICSWHSLISSLIRADIFYPPPVQTLVSFITLINKFVLLWIFDLSALLLTFRLMAIEPDRTAIRSTTRRCQIEFGFRETPIHQDSAATSLLHLARAYSSHRMSCGWM